MPRCNRNGAAGCRRTHFPGKLQCFPGEVTYPEPTNQTRIARIKVGNGPNHLPIGPAAPARSSKFHGLPPFPPSAVEVPHCVDSAMLCLNFSRWRLGMPAAVEMELMRFIKTVARMRAHNFNGIDLQGIEGFPSGHQCGSKQPPLHSTRLFSTDGCLKPSISALRLQAPMRPLCRMSAFAA